ncbi:MAG: class I SAM-dependent methyltransferase [Gammaproteobacteria bacterium]|nr:class I SAM-dependent methyltransferase [Gammaproteobacteria bacterium]
MTPDEIAKSYDQIADRWDSDSFDRANGIKQHDRAIAFLKNHNFALDIGCGSSGRFIEHLSGYGLSVEGLDVSSRMIELARQRHPDTTFHHADIIRWNFEQQYDFISAWDSIWHVPLADHESVLTKMLQGLAQDGVCIFTAGGRDAPEEKVDSAMGPPMYYSVLGIPRILQVIAENDCVCRHLEYDQYPELHIYVIAQRM